jgi:hypothetical protein
MICEKNNRKAVRSFPIFGSINLFNCVSDRSVISNIKPSRAPGSKAQKTREYSVSCISEKNRDTVTESVTYATTITETAFTLNFKGLPSNILAFETRRNLSRFLAVNPDSIMENKYLKSYR